MFKMKQANEVNNPHKKNCVLLNTIQYNNLLK